MTPGCPYPPGALTTVPGTTLYNQRVCDGSLIVADLSGPHAEFLGRLVTSGPALLDAVRRYFDGMTAGEVEAAVVDMERLYRVIAGVPPTARPKTTRAN